MKKFALALLILLALVCGCVSTCPKNEVISGTSLTVGLWIPFNGTIYGLQAFNYLSGTKITSTLTNSCDISYKHSVTNSGFAVDSTLSKDVRVQ